MTEQEVNLLIDAKIAKVNMSQLPTATQTEGLYSIGYKGNQSVKFKTNLLQGDPLTVRRTYTTLALATADKNPTDFETGEPLRVGQFVAVTGVADNGIYQLQSLAVDGTPTLLKIGAIGDLSTYAKLSDLALKADHGYEINPKTLKEVEDEIAQLAGEYFVIPNKYIRHGTGIITDATSDSAITNYLDLAYVDKIVIKGRSSAAVALCAFYSEDKTYISSIYGVENDKVIVEINEIPLNAKYMIATGYGLGDDFLFLHTIASLNSKIKDIENSISDKEIVKINLNSTIIENGYWQFVNGERTINPTDTYKYSTPVAVQLGDEFITSSSVESGATTGSFHAMLDEDMNIIGAFLTADGYKITQELIDAGVRYISFSYRPNDEKALTLTRIADISDMYEKIFDSQSDIKAVDLKVANLEEEISNISGKISNISGIGAMGASLMYYGNVWFNLAVSSLGITPYNKAESGIGTPVHFADKLWRGTYCSDEEFEDIDVLAIQFASSMELDSTLGLLDTIDEYTVGFDADLPYNQFTSYTSAQQLDYILKFWQNWCYEQKDNALSKWYDTQHGKPFRVIFVTHWHDGRPYYNDAIRIVAERWGCAVCEFDKRIGFSKNQTMPDGSQVSILYAEDTQVIDGVLYGWHPKRGIDSEYIQGKMAFIFADSVKKYFGEL